MKTRKQLSLQQFLRAGMHAIWCPVAHSRTHSHRRFTQHAANPARLNSSPHNEEEAERHAHIHMTWQDTQHNTKHAHTRHTKTGTATTTSASDWRLEEDMEMEHGPWDKAKHEVCLFRWLK
jgi:hypothetical protein